MIRYFVIGIFILFSYRDASGEPVLSPRPDTIPPPPPPGPVMLNGPSFACTGDTSTYITEVPVACSCQWAIDGMIQPDTSSTFSISWEEAGSYIVTLLFVCEGGQTTEPEAILTDVTLTPDVFLGNDTILTIGQTILLDAGNPGCNYLWSTGATTQTILVSQAGTYSVEVYNTCGNDEDTIVVTIQVGIPEQAPTGQLFYRVEVNRLIITEYPEGLSQMEILDISGKKIYSGGIRREIPLPSPGFYIIKLFSKERTLSRKIVVP